MSITDELRAGGKHAPVSNTRWFGEEELLAIADRIDREHAEAVADALQLRGEPDRWVELPVDADGVPIHVGDVLTDGEYTFTVCELAACGDGSWSIRNEDGNAWVACDVTHHHPDSWVRIIGDAMSFEGDGWYSTRDDAMAELVERCRRLAGADASAAWNVRTEDDGLQQG